MKHWAGFAAGKQEAQKVCDHGCAFQAALLPPVLQLLQHALTRESACSLLLSRSATDPSRKGGTVTSVADITMIPHTGSDVNDCHKADCLKVSNEAGSLLYMHRPEGERSFTQLPHRGSRSCNISFTKICILCKFFVGKSDSFIDTGKEESYLV